MQRFKEAHHLSAEEKTLLTTVQVKKAHDETFVTIRALEDQGSQVNFITERCTIPKLPRDKLNDTLLRVRSVTVEYKDQAELYCQLKQSGNYNEIIFRI